MDWTRTETLAIAQHSCTQCHGLGLRAGRKGVITPCNCTFRAIFRACFERFRDCTMQEKHMSRVSIEANPGRERKSTWGRKDEEYIADFCLVSRRTLDEEEYRIFKFHYLLGADWRLCCRKLKLDRGAFFHTLYKVQQKLGRTFRELQPYALYPLDQYFQGTASEARALRSLGMPVEDAIPQTNLLTMPPPPPPLRFPIRKAA